MQPQNGATNRIAVSLALPDTANCLETLRRLAPQVSLAELRLDMMRSFDLQRLIRRVAGAVDHHRRRPRGGGHFRRLGSGATARAVAGDPSGLRHWMSENGIRWPEFGGRGPEGTQLIASRHWYSRMPDFSGLT